MVEPTPLKNMSQNGNLPQVGVKAKNIRNHHLVGEFLGGGVLMTSCEACAHNSSCHARCQLKL